MCRQVLPPYFFGDLHWAATHVLCLAGALLGGAAAYAYSAHINTRRHDGAPDWLVRIRHRITPASRLARPQITTASQ